MAQTMKITDLLFPKKSEYVRGKVSRDNLEKLAVLYTTKAWPDGLPPILVRKLEKPAKRKGKLYHYRIIDGVHRATLALGTAIPKAGQAPADVIEGFKLAKRNEVPVTVARLTDLESEVEQLRINLSHGLIVDKKHRDAWVRHLVKERKMPAEKLAKMLHMTARSVYRMAKGVQTQEGPRKPKAKPAPKAETKAERAEASAAATRVEPASWTVETYIAMLITLSQEAKSHAPVIASYVRAHRSTLAPKLDALMATVGNALITEAAK